ncbi:hypothetical protein C0989_010096 [Termitomyces sp. Mn162]|nr:hypothetical protein C0989_010095 [Termitomyces sp. Mn162]KAG5348534.1 hypothetical protein C0989_010096 [Termitomyces sp. Mn162]
MRNIVTSHDVILDEQSGHRSLTAIEEADDLLATVTPSPTPLKTPGLLTPCQPIAPHICKGVPLHPPRTQVAESDIAMECAPKLSETPQPNTAAISNLPTPDAIILCCLNRLQGVPASDLPTSYLAQDAYAFLALLSKADVDDDDYIPKSYKEAMYCPNLWLPAIQQELQVMEEQKVWRAVLESEIPAGKKVMGCQWVFANKDDVEGNIVREGRLDS